MRSLNHTFFSFVFNKTRRAALLSVLCFVAFATSCKKERFNNNNTGKELLDDELLGLSLIDTSTLAIKIVKSDSLRTDEVSSTVLLGSYVDPVFGKSNAELFTQIKTGGKVDFTFNGVPSSATVDSFYLQLPLVNYYGTLDAQTFEVYRLSEDIVKDNDYYSSQTLNNTSINYVKAGFEIIAPNPTDSVTIGGEKKSPMIRIKLDESLANDIINAGSTALSGDDAFVSWFKGLHIKVNNSTQASGEGAIVGIDIHSTEAKLVLNYTDASDTNVPKKQFDFKLGSNIAYFNHFTHDYTGTSVEALLNNPSLGDNEFYIQSMAGVNTEIDFPHLKNLAGVKNIVINKAILELPINNSSSTNYANPSSTFIFGFSNDGETVFLPDQFLGSIGGTLGTDATYKFNITSFVNKIISGEWTTSKLRVGPVGGSVTANRAVLYGVSSSSAKPVLKLYYSTY